MNGYSYDWKEGQAPNHINNAKIAPCKCDNFVPVVVLGPSSEALRKHQGVDTARGCRRNSKGHIPRATKFGDAIPADHKVFLMEEGESRLRHRYAIVAQELAMQSIQSYPCKTKTSRDDEKLTEFSRSRDEWNCRLSSKKSQKRSLHLLYCSADSMNSGEQNLWTCYLRNVQDLLSDGKVQMNGALKNNSVGQSYHSEQKSNTIQDQRTIKRGSINLASKYSQTFLWAMLYMRGEAGMETHPQQTLRNYRRRRTRCVFKMNENRRSSCAE